MDFSNVKLKICGMKYPDNIRQVSALNPDYMGFIFYEPSPRYVGKDFSISNGFKPSIKKVGVFVNHSEIFVRDTMRKYKFDYAQLHGDESLAFCIRLKEHGIKIIKVFRVDEDFDFATTRQFESVADFFLFDTKGKYYGGNSRPFNWTVLTKYSQAVTFFLSGGIQSESIAEMKKLTEMNIHGIDINSGAESAPGLKDINKLSEIINQLQL